MPVEVTGDGQTLGEAKAKKFIDLVAEGKDIKEAEKEAGVSLKTLREKGMLGRAAKALLARVEADRLLEKKTYESIARARTLELMLQDEDLKVALGATRVALGTGPQVAVQINNNLRNDPEVLASLKSLQLEVDEDGTGTD